MVTKRAEAATLNVINNIKEAIPRIQKGLPDDIRVSFELDQSPTYMNSVRGLVTEGLLGAALTGLMVLLFLARLAQRDRRGGQYPIGFRLCADWVMVGRSNDQFDDAGGLALAVGILVDEATVEVENIHTQLARGMPVARAVLVGNSLTVTPTFIGHALHLGGFFACTIFRRSCPRIVYRWPCLSAWR